MKINSYSFGKINISDKEYNSDLIIFPDSIYTNWWRKKGHLLQIEDLKKVIKFNPQILIIGTGKYGKMKVPKKVINEFEKYDTSVEVYKTDKAIKIYNKKHSKDVVCALHLTC